MRKRITRAALSLVLVAVLAVSAVMPAMAAGYPFKDVSGTAYYAKAVEWAYTNGIVGGTSATTFSPNTPVTRGMLVTMLFRAAGSPAFTSGTKFSDVASNAYYANPVYWAAANGFVGGTGGGKFGPTSSITRQDLVTILWRYSGSPAQGNAAQFADSSKISKYAVNAVNWARANGIVGGKDGNRFDPQGQATRAEVVTILYRYFSSIASVTPHVHSYVIDNQRTSTGTKNGETVKTTITTYACSCGDKYTDVKTETVIEGHTHSYTSKVTKPATCSATGIRTYTCSVCKNSYTENIPTVSHTWTSKTVHHDAVTDTRDVTEEWEHVWLWNSLNLNQDGVDAGLANAGSRGHKVCYAEYYQPKGSPHNLVSVREYVWTWDGSGNASSASSAMLKYWTFNYGMYWCTYGVGSDRKTETRVVQREYVAQDAYDEIIKTCSVCGETSSETEHVHTYLSEITKYFTCTEDGIITYTCNCGDTYTETDPAHHYYETWVHEPTYRDKGYTVYSCHRCGDFYWDDYTPPIPHEHKYRSTIYKYPTKDTEGLRIYICDLCQDLIEEPIPPTGKG